MSGLCIDAACLTFTVFMSKEAQEKWEAVDADGMKKYPFFSDVQGYIDQGICDLFSCVFFNREKNKGKEKVSAASNALEREVKETANMLIEDEVWNGDLENISRLTYLGADLNYRNDSGESLLFIACKNGNAEVAKFLIGSGVNCRK